MKMNIAQIAVMMAMAGTERAVAVSDEDDEGAITFHAVTDGVSVIGYSLSEEASSVVSLNWIAARAVRDFLIKHCPDEVQPTLDVNSVVQELNRRFDPAQRTGTSFLSRVPKIVCKVV